MTASQDKSDSFPGQGWLTLLALTAYWAWMYWWTKRLVREILSLARWLRREGIV